jgi:hypothetical protein
MSLSPSKSQKTEFKDELAKMSAREFKSLLLKMIRDSRED